MNSNIKTLYFLFHLTCFFISWGSACAKEEIPGILIEGADYAGKSTVCEALNKKLTARKINIHFGHGHISNSPVVKFLWQKAREEEDILQSSWHRAAVAIIDNTLFQPSSKTFYLQDRHWLSHHCRMKFLHPDVTFMPEAYMETRHKSFTCNIYLTANAEIRKKRFKQRGKKNVLNRYFIKNINKLIEYDNYCISQIPNNEKWLIIDTSYLEVEQIVNKILNFCQIDKEIK